VDADICAGGWAGGSPNSVGGGIVGDVFAAEDRALAMAVYTLGPVVGRSEAFETVSVALIHGLLEPPQLDPQSADI
jgi:hypothetical protein